MNTELIFEPQNLTKETIKRFLCPNASEQELMMGLQIAKTFNLNPMKREVYFVKYGNNAMSVLVGYEVYLKRAERSKNWNGMESSSEGSVKEGTLKAVVKIFKKNWDHPLTHEVYYSEYVQTKADGSPNRFWSTKPITMIKKVAVSQALRLAFPDEFDGMPYTSDEVVDQEKIVDIQLGEIDKPRVKEPVPEEDSTSAPLPLVIHKYEHINTDDLEEIAKRVFKGKKSGLVSWLKEKFNADDLSEIVGFSREQCKEMLLEMEIWKNSDKAQREMEKAK